MQARYLTECATCDGSIAPGEEIMRDAKGRWVHADLEQCQGDRYIGPGNWVDVPPPTCRRCNLVVPCWCDEPDVEDAADAALRRAKEAAARDPWEGF